MLVHTEKDWPALEAPLMVVNLKGWVDAGSAGELTVGALRESWPLRRVAHFDGDEFLDYHHRRPLVRLDAQGRRYIEWQDIEVLAGRAGPRDLVLLTGPEPARAWPSFIECAVDVIQRLGIEQVVAVAGLPSPVPHTAPIQVAGTVSAPTLTDWFETLLGSYHGPTGMQTALQVACGEHDIPMVTCWAQVPHYLSAMAWPGAALALLRRIAERTGVEARVEALEKADRERRGQIDEAVRDRPDIQALVRALEQGVGIEDVPSGEDLAAEIERFLAQGGEAGS